MKILIAGGCGFVGSNLCIHLKKLGYIVSSADNLQRKGSKYNLKRIKDFGIHNTKIDLSKNSNYKKLKKYNIIIDCCAEPSVEASKKNFDIVFDSNLISTKNLLSKCIRDKSKFIFISSSRVYSIKNLTLIGMKKKKKINMNFSTESPKSIYGFTKLASEDLIKEFSYLFKLDFLINRFGVIAGPWQFGKIDQGFVSLFVWRFLNKKKIKFIGYNGNGLQQRDILHINDFCLLIEKQIKKFKVIKNKSFTVGGGSKNTASLRKIFQICNKITGNKPKIKKIKSTSIYDIPYYKSCNDEVMKYYNWNVSKNLNEIIYDIYIWQKKNINLLKNYFN